MSIKIAVMTMKGGQAKTTLAINLAARIAKARRDVLLIDSDIQANVTTTFQRDHHCNLANVILGKVSDFEFIQLDRHLAFLPSGGEAMVEASSYLSHTRFKESLFKNLLSSINHRIVIIDTAPSWSEVSRNILMYVDFVIVPVVTDYLGFSGCDQIMSYIDEFKASMLGQCKAEVLGIAITRSHPQDAPLLDLSDSEFPWELQVFTNQFLRECAQTSRQLTFFCHGLRNKLEEEEFQLEFWKILDEAYQHHFFVADSKKNYLV